MPLMLKFTLIMVLVGLATACANAPAANDPTNKIQPIEEVLAPAPPQDLKEFMKVAAVQRLPKEDVVLTWTAAQADAYLVRNRKALGSEVIEAATHGARIVVLPEFAVTGYPNIPNVPPAEDNFRSREEIKPFVENIPGPSSTFFGALSKKYKIWIQYGLAEVDPKSDVYYNAAVVVDPDGQIVAHYRKQNLFGIEYKSMAAGTEVKTFLTPVGKIGVLICADTYKESVLNQYKEAKVDVLLNSSSWVTLNTAIPHWTNAAKTVGAYLVSANDALRP